MMGQSWWISHVYRWTIRVTALLSSSAKLIINSTNISKFWAQDGNKFIMGMWAVFKSLQLLYILVFVYFQTTILFFKVKSSPSSTSWLRSTCKLSFGTLKHYLFMVPPGVSSKCPKNWFTFGTRIKCLLYPARNQDFRCLSITFHVTGRLRSWIFRFLGITMTRQLQTNYRN